MKILNRYILTEWALAFFVAMLANTGLLIVEDIYKNAGDFVHSGITVYKFFWYYFWLTVRVLPVVIPISFFLSLLFSLGKLHKNNELLAMRMAGKNIFQITKPLWVISIILTLLSIGFNLSISSRAAQNTQNFCAKMKSLSVRRNVAFDNVKDRRVWFMALFDRKKRAGLDVMLCFYDEYGREMKRLFAKRAEYGGERWVFHEGSEIEFDTDTEHPLRMETFDTKKYEFEETPGLFFSLKKRIKYLSLLELRKILSFSKNSKSYIDYSVQYHRLMISPLSCMLILFITIPFATTGVRRSPMSGVAKACGVLFIFYILSNMFSSFGMHGMIPLFAAVLAPYLVILMFSYILYRGCM